MGGGVLTFVAEACAISAAFYLSHRLLSAAGIPSDLSHPCLALILGAWVFKGSWRFSHRYVVGREGWEGLFKIPLCLVKTMAAACFVVLLATEIGSLTTLPDARFSLVYLLVSTVVLFTLHLASERFSRSVSQSISRKNRVLVVGNNPRSRGIIDTLRSDPSLRTEVVGLLDVAGENPAKALNTEAFPLSGDVTDLECLLISGHVDEVLVTLPVRSMYAEVERVLHTCADAGIRAEIYTDIFDVGAPRRELRRLNGSPALAYASGPPRTFRLKVKRSIDVVGALLGLLVLGLPMLLIAAAIKLTSRGPVFFGQRRSGLNGRTFRCLKFRTMVADAEAQKERLRALNEVSGPVFKIRKDPRVTRVGRFLRKYSLDELPQLLNVLVGDMSLVGPRPPTPDEVRQYNRWQLRRLSMRPGLTCIWQVSGRNDIPFEDWIRLDLQYIDRWSLPLDLLLLLKTVPTVLRGTGA